MDGIIHFFLFLNCEEKNEETDYRKKDKESIIKKSLVLSDKYLNVISPPKKALTGWVIQINKTRS